MNRSHFFVLNRKQYQNSYQTVKIQVAVFSVMTPCSVAVGYQRFGGLC
jgi:hypothetical protein